MLVLLLILSIFLQPLVVLGESALGNALWYILSSLFVIYIYIVKPKYNSSLESVRLFSAIALFVCFICSISLAVSGDISGRGMAEVIRPLFFATYFLLGYEISRSSELKVLSFVRVSALLCFGYLIMDTLYSDFVDDIELYFGKFDNVVSGRLFFPFVNPYDLAIFLIIPSILSLYYRKYLYFLIFLILLIFTQSRTGLAVFMLAFALYLVKYNSSRKLVIYIPAFFVVSLGLLTYVFTTEAFEGYYVIENTKGLFTGKSTSLSKRLDQFAHLDGLPLFGFGAVPNSLYLIENGFLFEVMKMGVLSVFTVFFYYLLPSMLAVLILVRSQGVVPVVASIFILVNFIGSIANVFVYQPKISFLYWTSFGIAMSELYLLNLNKVKSYDCH